MSVINKMLRDLDQRQMAGSPDGALPRAPLPVQEAVPFVAPRSNASGAWRIGLGIALLAGLGLGGWMVWPHMGTEVPAPAMPVASPLAATTPAPAVSEPLAVSVPPLAVVPGSGVADAPVGAASASEAMQPRPPAQTAEPPALATVAPASPARQGRAGDAASSSHNPAVSLRMEFSLSTRQALNAVLAGSAAPVVAPPVASPKTSPAPAETQNGAQRQQQASADALVQAQTLWSAGSHAAALELLQQSVDAAERSVKAGASPPGNPAMLALVRELVRMQMTQSHFAAVWDLLVRLEPVLGNQADLWGLRGNTGQRLGRHQDSVNAYRTALQSRPDEQRWLLGCAVSLAALGQSAQAAEMAERARSVGPVSRDVQVYLQQMGVPFKDK